MGLGIAAAASLFSCTWSCSNSLEATCTRQHLAQPFPFPPKRLCFSNLSGRQRRRLVVDAHLELRFDKDKLGLRGLRGGDGGLRAANSEVVPRREFGKAEHQPGGARVNKEGAQEIRKRGAEMGKRRKNKGASEGGNQGGGEAGGKRPQDKGRFVHPVECSSWQVCACLCFGAVCVPSVCLPL